MSQEARVFSVWPPKGDECAGATATVVSRSPKAALRSLRQGRFRVTSKEPVHIDEDLSDFDRSSPDEMLWQPTGRDDWTVLE